MKKGLSEIICIIDRSGSMEAIKNDAIGGFNSFLEVQKKLPGTARLTFVQFNTDIEVIHENKPLNKVKPITDNDYLPGGGTALLDAVGKTIDSTGRRLANTAEGIRPEKVIIAILTDGEENSSREYGLSTIKEMIRHQKEMYSWEFIFLGANQDAFSEAYKIGIDKKDSFNFAATGEGVRAAYSDMSNSVADYRKKVKSISKKDATYATHRLRYQTLRSPYPSASFTYHQDINSSYNLAKLKTWLSMAEAEDDSLIKKLLKSPSKPPQSSP